MPAAERSAICPSYSWRPWLTAKPGFALKVASMKLLTKDGQSALCATALALPLSGELPTLQPAANARAITDAIRYGRISLSSAKGRCVKRGHACGKVAFGRRRRPGLLCR